MNKATNMNEETNRLNLRKLIFLPMVITMKKIYDDLLLMIFF